MKHLLAALLCLLLCGCAPQTPPETEPPQEAAPEKVCMYDPHHPIEQTYPGEVRGYPLTTLGKVHGILPLGKQVVTLSGTGNTRLTLLSGEELWEEASLTLDFTLQQEDPSLRIHDDAISFFDPVNLETLVLDHALQEIQRIAAPSGLSGMPLLSDDRSTLYYCTPWAVMAWNLESGIRRTVRELACDSHELTGLHCNSTVLQCRIQNSGETSLLMLSAENGMELHTLAPEIAVTTRDARFFAAIPAGKMTLLVYGEDDSQPRMLLPEQFQSSQYYLAEDHSVVTVCENSNGFSLDCYELNTGIRRSSLLLEPQQTPKAIINCIDHSLYILLYDTDRNCDTLYRWDVLRQPPSAGNGADCSFPYFSYDDPDTAALDACQEYADIIGEKYGITLRIGDSAAAVQPWDYRFVPEHLAPVLQRELERLDRQLSRYPETVLHQTADHFSGLTLCLVREITGTPESGSLSTATGLQFFQDGSAYVVIAMGKYAGQALYHELYHAMESRILTESTALDQWDNLNPAGFVYGAGDQDAEIYLRGQTRAFVDHYSMTYPKEDRARIFEYAMLSGHEVLFRSEYLQRKLAAVCTAIRDTYDLKQYPEILPWEQYLVTKPVSQ